MLIALGERGYDQKEARVTIGIHWDINPKPSQPVPTKSPKKDSAKSQVNALEKRLAKTLAADRKKIRKLNRLARKALVAAVLPQEPLT